MEIDYSYPCSTKIYQKGKNKQNKYIVIHFTGDGNVPAKNYAKCNQFNNAHRDASWHYCVSNSTEHYKIYQSVKDEDIAWHCGAKIYKHKECRNSNSIGIEHCCYWKDGKAYFEEGTIGASVELVVSLMKKYNIPLSNVVRHYDVTEKNCPQPFLYNDGQWENYLKRIDNKLNEKEVDNELFNAISTIIKEKKIALEFDKWKRKDLIKLENVKYLIPKLARINYDKWSEEVYRLGVNELIQEGVINEDNKEMWYNYVYKVEWIRSLLIKFASQK